MRFLMGFAELKYFEIENSQASVKSYSKSLNPFLLAADLFQQNTIFVLQQLRTPKVELLRFRKE